MTNSPSIKRKRNIFVKDNAVTPFPNQVEGQPIQGWAHIQEVVTHVKRTSPTRTSVVTETRHCPLNGELDSLREMVADWAKDGMPGRIMVTEMLESELSQGFVENTKDLDKQVKIAGETKIPCTLDGERIFRFSMYTEDENDVDTLIAHDNGEYIRAEQARIKSVSKVATPELAKADLSGK